MVAGLDKALAGAVKWIQGNMLVDTVRVVRPSVAAPVLDEDTGELTYPAAAVVYEGLGAVVPGNAQGQFAAIPTAGQQWVTETKSMHNLYTPLDAPIPAKDDIVTVTAVHNPANGALLGRTWICDDPGRAGTVEVVRITPIDMQQTRPVTS
jgi:hypothetical protein